eukprot:9487144-Pyramimonas_sp.AAC.1
MLRQGLNNSAQLSVQRHINTHLQSLPHAAVINRTYGSILAQHSRGFAQSTEFSAEAMNLARRVSAKVGVVAGFFGSIVGVGGGVLIVPLITGASKTALSTNNVRHECIPTAQDPEQLSQLHALLYGCYLVAA